MIEAWRIVKARRASDAFSGEGASNYAGRWNLQGTACVYLADSLPLAALELFMHLNRDSFNMRFVYFKIQIPPAAVQTLDPALIPKDWRASPAGDATKMLGTKWVIAKTSPTLKVPSAIMPAGLTYNYLLNPAHPDYPTITIEPAKEFIFDPRMWK